MCFQPHRAAFTLIELLVVISGITLLMDLLVSVLSKAKEQARRVACMGNIRQFIVGIKNYASDYREHLPIGLSDFALFLYRIFAIIIKQQLYLSLNYQDSHNQRLQNSCKHTGKGI